jgi:hypothetical protein
MTIDDIEEYADLNKMRIQIQVLHSYIESIIQRMNDRPHESGAIAEGVLRDIVSMGLTSELIKFADGYQKHTDITWAGLGYHRNKDGMLIPKTEWEMT